MAKPITWIRLEASLRLPAYVGAVFVYALFSSSTPDSITWAEVLIGLLLLVFVGLTGVTHLARGLDVLGAGHVPWQFTVAFTYFASIPAAIGIWVRGNDLSDFVRDYIPFIYLFLPALLFLGLRRACGKWVAAITVGLCFTGVAYSIRHFLADEVGLSALGSGVVFGDMNYFAMDPAVIFAATFLLSVGVTTLTQRVSPWGVAILTLGLVAFLCLLGVVVRAQIVLVLSAVLSTLAWRVSRNPFSVKSWGVILVLCGLAIWLEYASGLLNSLLELVVAKFESVGVLNSRDLEMDAVVADSSTDVCHLLFGEGWGGTIFNPAGGGSVRFTHNVLLYAQFKAGLVGVAMMAAYLYPFCIGLGRILLRAAKRDDAVVFALAAALFNAFVLNIALEPGFKFLTFGLVLLLILLVQEWLANHPTGRMVATPALRGAN